MHLFSEPGSRTSERLMGDVSAELPGEFPSTSYRACSRSSAPSFQRPASTLGLPGTCLGAKNWSFEAWRRPAYLVGSSASSPPSHVGPRPGGAPLKSLSAPQQREWGECAGVGSSVPCLFTPAISSGFSTQRSPSPTFTAAVAFLQGGGGCAGSGTFCRPRFRETKA